MGHSKDITIRESSPHGNYQAQDYHLAQIEACQREIKRLTDKVLELERVTRVEVIRKSEGRIFTIREVKVDIIELQDDNRTLKLFIE